MVFNNDMSTNNNTATATNAGRNFWTVTFTRNGRTVAAVDVRSNKANAVQNAWEAWATNDSAAVAWKEGR
jgi:hypothetical protein